MALARQGAEETHLRPWYRAYLVSTRLFNDDVTAARYGLEARERQFLRGAAGAIVFENGYENRAFVEVRYYSRGDDLYDEWADVKRAAGEPAVAREPVPRRIDCLDVLLWLWIAESRARPTSANGGAHDGAETP